MLFVVYNFATLLAHYIKPDTELNSNIEILSVTHWSLYLRGFSCEPSFPACRARVWPSRLLLSSPSLRLRVSAGCLFWIAAIEMKNVPRVDNVQVHIENKRHFLFIGNVFELFY